MAAFKKLSSIYLVGVAIFVAVWFIISSFFDAGGVWDVANYLIAAGLLLALMFHFYRKFAEDEDDSGDGVSRRYLEVNAGLYLTAGIAILFLRNWFWELTAMEGETSSTVGIVWVVVNTLFPLVAGATGCAMWRDSSE